MKYELIANAIVIGGWALGLALLAGSFVIWYFGWDVRAKRLARRLRSRVGKPTFVRSASWWVDRHGVRPVARHAARLAWTDPTGRWRAVRRWCARQYAAATDVRYGQLRLGAVA